MSFWEIEATAEGVLENGCLNGKIYKAYEHTVVRYQVLLLSCFVSKNGMDWDFRHFFI